MRVPIVCTCLLLQVLAGYSQVPAIYDVIIQEIMPKPSPVAGLPPYEYIELRNVSAAPVQLQNWHLVVNKRDVLLPTCLLQPDSLLLLCPIAAVSSYNIPNIRGLDRFPALPDDSGLVVLYDQNKKVMHAIAYNQSWYGNSRLSKGGYSLEMINAAFPCSGKINWCASPAPASGTPGKPNAAAAATTDDTRPDLLYAVVTDSMHVLLQFSKTLDSTLAADPARYQVNGGINVAAVVVVPPLFNLVQLQLSAAIQSQQVYTLDTRGLADCKGLESGIKTAVTLGLPQQPAVFDVVLNELLFYPPAGVPEFIELYNRSNKVIDLQQLRICARKQDGSLGTVKNIAPAGRLLMPGKLVALTTDAALLCSHYTCKARENIQEVNSLPSMPMAEGQLVLLRSDSTVIDELHYTDGQHFPLASALQGISLERLNTELPTSNGDNWHSAAATAGYATPGWPNSQQWPQEGEQTTITVMPAVFSPDGDGIADLAQLTWQLPAPGCVANVTIFDAQGKPVRFLARNILLGNTGYLRWDGSGENAVVLPSGIYIFFIEIFNLKGHVKRWKRTVVMARKLN
ncbi:lamin tail-like protein [Chitinophaga niastensis]|uniref:Lamin tail-like protein n=1 Tax=Chitinophaga niastensis TaxID=536980 RepID=A0A2P8HTI4_CHINA|nr:hypothetical protein [Chitinophaga niastensis]PSL49536.1 lamin tail-like protein [Chitinophaga niastensis]